ncbi:MAG: alpha-amylase [Chloroflexi bacterium]|nr:alpha-amylase [Chloroflexota bacterium]MBI3339775.1 alpha-amylase [Chloroflexota bacterium]
MRKTLTIFLLFASLLTGCLPIAPAVIPATSTETSVPPTQTIATTPWWNDSVFYEIFVRSFNDSNGDGIGDFNGITQKLNYLQNLGVTGLWLMPINPSPSYHGYDVTDYYNANPQYGTMDDFKNLLREAHKRGIKIIIDLVINHTSDQHPWFKSAKKDPNSPYRDWYIWSLTDPKYVGPWGERVWHPSPTGYYYGIFESSMPDLNYNNPAVTQEIERVIKFWLTDVGIDGFRMDAIKHLVEEGVKQQNTESTHLWLKNNFYPTYKAANPNALAVGELSGDSINIIARYVQGKQFDLAFNFPLAISFLDAASTGGPFLAIDTLNLSEKVLPDRQYATFLTNHDQNRVMSVLNGDANKAKVAAALLLTSPGTPFIYYGEEIGQQGKKPDEDIRLPMQWSADANAGFTTGRPWRAPFANYQTANVAAQQNDPNSLLSLYKSLIRLRADHSALRTGGILLPDTASTGLFASLRFNDQEAVLVLVNLSDISLSDYSLTLDKSSLPAGTHQLSMLLGADSNASFTINADGGFSNFKPLSEIPPYAINIYQLNP